MLKLFYCFKEQENIFLKKYIKYIKINIYFSSSFEYWFLLQIKNKVLPAFLSGELMFTSPLVVSLSISTVLKTSRVENSPPNL